VISNRFMHGGDVWQGEGPEHWIDFSANLNPDGPPEVVVQAVLDAVSHMRCYPDIRMKAAVDGLSTFLCVPGENVLPTAGGIAALEIAAGLAHADTAIIAQPGFVEYERISQLHGLNVIHVQTLQGQHVIPAVHALEPLLRPNAIVWLGNPANPAGTICSHEQVLALLDGVERVGATLVVDEAFIDYSPDMTVRHNVEAHPSLLVTGSLTKILAIPGVRLGYLCACGDMIHAARRIQSPWSLNAFAAAIAAVLPATLGETARAVVTNAARREELGRELTAMGIHVFPSHANFLLLDVRGTGYTGTELASRLRSRGILIRDCSAYVGLDSRHVRIAVRSPNDNHRLAEEIRSLVTARNGEE
jgi:histidinol-phosphate/aromatic aminotransferase/cobyric acid decarboxylase-like protein